METLRQDLRYGVRLLGKNPGVTAVAVLAVALGIGANTAIFSALQAVLWRPLPYDHPERLVMVWETAPQHGLPLITLSAPDVVDYRAQNHVFDGFAAFNEESFNLTGVGEPVRVRGMEVSTDLFPLLGVPPAAGRFFSREEGEEGRNRVVVLSHGLWARQFGSNPAVAGRSVLLNDQNYVVVGVLPPAFRFPPPFSLYGTMSTSAELFVPLTLTPEQLQQRIDHGWMAVARLKPEATLAQAQADLAVLNKRIQERFPADHGSIGVEVVALQQQVVGPFRAGLLVLSGAVGLVLLIACANVANILLARARAREKELAIRLALGAGRWRVARQLLTESLLLSALGGAAGLLLAYWGITWLPALSPGNIPRLEQATLDGSVLAFTLALSLLTGIVFGLLPAWQASRTDLHEPLKEGGRSAAASARQSFRSALVVSEVALSVVLLVGAGLLLRSFLRLQGTEVGFNPTNVLTLRVDLPPTRYEDSERVATFFRDVMPRLQALPGVTSTAAVSALPLTGGSWETIATIEGRPIEDLSKMNVTSGAVVTPDYFRALGIPLLQGRGFTEHDTAESRGAVIVDEVFARRFLPGEDPVGKRFKLGRPQDDAPWLTIVGVVGAAQRYSIDAEVRPGLYLPHAQAPRRGMVLVMRSQSDPHDLVSAARAQIFELDSDLPLSNVQTLKEVVADSLAQPRFTLLLLGLFAGLALVLAAVGVYGVISLAVSQRTHEIGVRMALGAQRRDVFKLVVAQGMGPVLGGLALGVAGAVALSRFLSSLLYGISPTDPATYAVIVFLLVAVALLACVLPARRAARVDPMVALRYE